MGEIGFAQLKLNCFEYLRYMRYAIIDKICQNAVVLHVELGNIICLLPLIERASLGWDRWDLMGFCGVRFGLPQSRFLFEKNNMPYAQHQTKKNNASLCNIKCKIIVVFPFRKGCWAVGSLLAGEHKLLLEQLRPLQPMLRDGREQS